MSDYMGQEDEMAADAARARAVTGEGGIEVDPLLDGSTAPDGEYEPKGSPPAVTDTKLGWLIRPTSDVSWAWTWSKATAEGGVKAGWQVIEVADASLLAQIGDEAAMGLDGRETALGALQRIAALAARGGGE